MHHDAPVTKRVRTLRLAAALLAATAAGALSTARAQSSHSHHTTAAPSVVSALRSAAPSVVSALRSAADGASDAGFTAVGANVVTVVAREYAFTLPDSIPAGLTTFVLKDEGHEQHHVFLVTLPDGKTPADLITTIRGGGPPPAWGRAPWMRMIGGPNTPVPGGESNATIVLEPGRYVLFCVIPAPDGALHATKGMVHTLIVTPARRRAAPPPQHDVQVTLTDYAFRFSRPIAAGAHTLRIANAASQPHEMVMMRLPPGKSVADLVAWVAKPAGPPPVIPAGGITDIPPGGVAYVRAAFTPGEYALICFSPDERDRAPHFAHGMTRQFTVR